MEFTAKKFYLQQLGDLEDLAHEFAQAHPTLAPRLGVAGGDPDAERVLQGVAFLTGLLRAKLEDDFPEIIHSLLDLVYPHYLRPLPSVSVVQFRPRPGLARSLTVPAGATVASTPVDGTTCFFRTCFATNVHPLEIVDAAGEQAPGRLPSITLSLRLKGMDLAQWQPRSLRLFFGETLEQATTLFLLLTRRLDHVELRPAQGGEPYILPRECLRPVGFDRDSALFPHPERVFPGFRLLQEYFVLPQKFLFLDLEGWDQWTDRGFGGDFQVCFRLDRADLALPRITPRKFFLFATPVVNLFPHAAEPVLLDHRTEKVRITPSRARSGHYQVYSVDRVVGCRQGSVAKREYQPLDLYRAGDREAAVYQLLHSRSPVDDSPELHLAFPYAAGRTDLAPEVLSITLTCSNGPLAERLTGEALSQTTFDLPEAVIPAGLMSPTPAVQPSLGHNAAWKFLSHLSLNFQQVAQRETLQSLLRLYVYPEGREQSCEAGLKRIQAIRELQAEPTDRIIEGAVVRGTRLTLTADREAFAGPGDLYLFGCVLDQLFGFYAALNTFTQFELRETFTGDSYSWPPRMGYRPMI